MADQQQSLFETAPEPWELDATVVKLVATVLFPEGPGNEYDYLVPEVFQETAAEENHLEAGRRVQVSFGRGNRTLVGYCIRLEQKTVGARPLKTIQKVIDPKCLLSSAMLQLTRWIAEYYLCPWGQVLEAVVPGGVRKQAGTRKTTFYSMPSVALAQLAAGELKLSAKQQRVLECLKQSPAPMTLGDLTVQADCKESPIRTLQKKGLISATTKRVPRFQMKEPPAPARQSPLTLNPDQQAALATILEAIQSSQHRCHLLHGVTGSGKTEVYIQAIEEIVRYGKQAIVLVPEISLTPQTVERFRARFDTVAVLHSHQSDAERHWHWHRIATGEVQVVVGARSAIFAPTPNLGLIVIDEEHENTFKQSTAPRYHARDVALRRSEAENVPLVLGTATPSLESWHLAKQNKFQLITMPNRILNRPLPDVRVVDMREQRRDQPFRGSISRMLHQAMDEALKAGGKIVLLLNRRGFSTHIQCNACGEAVACPECEIPLTFHKHGTAALCHYCEYQIAAPSVCPSCNSDSIRYSGTGTQKLQAEIQARYPNAPCLRMDTDSMKKPGSHAAALAEFRDGAARILLGTQMIAKGLDFPAVTLVGVINADTALQFPDFRASERTFGLITQVAGRTGRGEKGGRVVVQTLSPEHPAIRAAARHDFITFANGELPHRECLGYPPFGTMVRLVVRGTNEAETRNFANEIAAHLKFSLITLDAKATLLGPSPAPFAKLRGKFRFQLLLRGYNGDALREATSLAKSKLKPPGDVLWIADVDPQEML